MTQYVKTSNILDKEFLLGTDWDLIELDITTSVDELVSWYNTITEKYDYLRFDFSLKHLLKDQYATGVYDSYGFENVLQGGIYSWSLDWPIEKDIPIPPTFSAKTDLFPELEQNLKFVIQEKFKFGYFSKLCKTLGEDAFCFSRITQHDSDARIAKHVDAGLGLRVHVPIVATNASRFLFGDSLDRSYTFEPGKTYIINAKIPHCTINQGPVRAHIISDPSVDKLLDLMKMRVHI